LPFRPLHSDDRFQFSTCNSCPSGTAVCTTQCLPAMPPTVSTSSRDRRPPTSTWSASQLNVVTRGRSSSLFRHFQRHSILLSLCRESVHQQLKCFSIMYRFHTVSLFSRPSHGRPHYVLRPHTSVCLSVCLSAPDAALARKQKTV